MRRLFKQEICEWRNSRRIGFECWTQFVEGIHRNKMQNYFISRIKDRSEYKVNERARDYICEKWFFDRIILKRGGSIMSNDGEGRVENRNVRWYFIPRASASSPFSRIGSIFSFYTHTPCGAAGSGVTTSARARVPIPRFSFSIYVTPLTPSAITASPFLASLGRGRDGNSAFNAF